MLSLGVAQYGELVRDSVKKYVKQLVFQSMGNLSLENSFADTEQPAITDNLAAEGPLNIRYSTFG